MLATPEGERKALGSLMETFTMSELDTTHTARLARTYDILSRSLAKHVVSTILDTVWVKSDLSNKSIFYCILRSDHVTE